MFFKIASTYLQQAYPYYWGSRGLLRFFIIIAVISFLFSYAFQPFEVYEPEHKLDYLWICVIHSLVPCTAGYGYFLLVNWYGVNEENWNIGKELLHVSMLLVVMGIGSFLVRDIVYDNPNNWSWRYFYEEIRNTFMVGMLLALIFVPLNFSRLFRKHEQDAAFLLSEQQEEPPSVEGKALVPVKTQVKADDFQLVAQDLLFAKASGNYTEIYLATDGSIEVLLKRISIKELEQQLSPFSFIVKTHRAYLVNTRMINEVKGNAQGYRLSFELVSERVPVARGMIAPFNMAMGREETS